ncbi:hypothetical protein Scep_024016 [Stephania cephalantha]|uniref:Uncharacterized protein n=1 Tax=Stephania cephalantha TaxID=152367 RepID=A0AAP0EWV7_9MAGN
MSLLRGGGEGGGVEENTICLIFDHFSGFREMCGYRFVVLLIGCRTLRIS